MADGGNTFGFEDKKLSANMQKCKSAKSKLSQKRANIAWTVYGKLFSRPIDGE